MGPAAGSADAEWIVRSLKGANGGRFNDVRKCCVYRPQNIETLTKVDFQRSRSGTSADNEGVRPSGHPLAQLIIGSCID